jgi:protein TonB
VTTDLFAQYGSLDEGLAPLPRSVWIVGALGALTLHVAAGLFAFHYMQRGTDDLGAPGMFIDVELASPRRDPVNLPMGPDTPAAASAPAVVEQKTVVQQTDLPKDVPTDTDDPYRTVTLDEMKKPNDEDPKITAVQAAPSDASIASEETAVPTVENAQESTKSTTPSQGSGESAVRERATWEKELAAHFNRFKRYPAQRAMQAAQVVVSFVVNEAGHIVSFRIVKGSGDAAFDDAALAMLQRADPVPPPPPLVANRGLSFTLPVIFHVKPEK